MTISDQVPFLERLQFFSGQRLFAEDLRDLDTFHREMRELHNRSLHQPGIGAGFAVSGQAGDREVTIGPGYAIDAEGHEIIHTTSRQEPIPPVAGDSEGNPVWYDLAVSSPADDALEESETRQGICLPRGVTRLREEPEFCWVRLEQDAAGMWHAADSELGRDLAEGRRIRIVRTEIQNCRLRCLSIAERLSARPPSQPYIACGRQDLAEATPSWIFVSGGLGIALLTFTVDTASAGFVATPCYFVTFEWSVQQREQFEGRTRSLVELVTSSSAPSATDAQKLMVVPILRQLENPTPSSFQLAMLGIGTQPRATDEGRVPVEGPSVVWMGVE